MLAGSPERTTAWLKFRPMLLKSLPDTLRSQAMATHRTSMVDMLYSSYVEAGPGTQHDRMELLKAVGKSQKPETTEVYNTLQRWKADLVRLQRAGITPPDPSMQLNTLKGFVSKMGDTNSEFQFRLHAFLARKTCLVT